MTTRAPAVLTKPRPGPFKLHCKTTRNKGQTLDEVVSRTVVGDSKKLEICRLSFHFWQPEIFEFLTTKNIWMFDNQKYLSFWQPEIFECLQPECLNNGSNLKEAIKHGSVSSWKHSVHSMPLSSILKLFEILNTEQILTKEQTICWIYLRSTGQISWDVFLWNCEQVAAAFSAS